MFTNKRLFNLQKGNTKPEVSELLDNLSSYLVSSFSPLTLNVPILDKKKKINLNFYFHTSL